MPRPWKRWTDEEDEILLDLRGRQVPRALICQKLGRSIMSIDERYKTIRIRRGEPMRVNGRPRKLNVDGTGSPSTQAGPSAGPFRAVSSHVLAADSDLRGRIDERGLTGGIFGDPAPGRSALDKRNRQNNLKENPHA